MMENVSFYKENGFLMCRDLINNELIQDLFVSINNILKKYSKETKTYKNWEDPAFHEKMLNLRANEAKVFSLIYDTMQVSLPLFSLGSQKNIATKAAELLKVDENSLAASGFMLRMDVPHDNKNKLDWHQDISYFHQNKNGDNGLVIWIPLLAVDSFNGTVKAIEGSHKFGEINPQHKEKEDYITSEQFIIPSKYVDIEKEIDLVAKGGDVAFFNMNLIHRSGDNTSDKIRFVAGVRYHNMASSDFLPGRLKYDYRKDK